MKDTIIKTALIIVLLMMLLQPIMSFSQELPLYLRDRGTGIPLSIFGSYINKGALLIYPFYEYYYDSNMEYEPADLGFGSREEYRGRYRANEFLIFIAYGISDQLAIEFEAGVISAKLNKSDYDNSAMPPNIDESGLSDVEGQIRWRWSHESTMTPELYNYFEFVLPTGKKYKLIGTSNWEFKLGLGLIKGFRWGTITTRAALDYSHGEKKIEMGEFALEYLKKISSSFNLFVMFEGSEDEISLVPGIHWDISRTVLLRVNTGIGVTSKATDLAPEVGMIFSFFP
jgi:hypothetical protein